MEKKDCFCDTAQNTRCLATILIRNYSSVLESIFSQVDAIDDPILKNKFIFYKIVYSYFRDKDIETIFKSDITLLKLFTELTILLVRSFFMNVKYESSLRKNYKDIANIVQDVLNISIEDKKLHNFYLTMEILEWFNYSNVPSNSSRFNDQRTFSQFNFKNVEKKAEELYKSFEYNIDNMSCENKYLFKPNNVNEGSVSQCTDVLNERCSENSTVEFGQLFRIRPKTPGPFIENSENRLSEEKELDNHLKEAIALDKMGDQIPIHLNGANMSFKKTSDIRVVDSLIEKSCTIDSGPNKLSQVNTSSKITDMVNPLDIDALIKKCERFFSVLTGDSKLNNNESTALEDPTCSKKVTSQPKLVPDDSLLHNISQDNLSNPENLSNFVSLVEINSLGKRFETDFSEAKSIVPSTSKSLKKPIQSDSIANPNLTVEVKATTLSINSNLQHIEMEDSETNINSEVFAHSGDAAIQSCSNVKMFSQSGYPNKVSYVSDSLNEPTSSSVSPIDPIKQSLSILNKRCNDEESRMPLKSKLNDSGESDSLVSEEIKSSPQINVSDKPKNDSTINVVKSNNSSYLEEELSESDTQSNKCIEKQEDENSSDTLSRITNTSKEDSISQNNDNIIISEGRVVLEQNYIGENSTIILKTNFKDTVDSLQIKDHGNLLFFYSDKNNQNANSVYSTNRNILPSKNGFGLVQEVLNQPTNSAENFTLDSNQPMNLTTNLSRDNTIKTQISGNTNSDLDSSHLHSSPVVPSIDTDFVSSKVNLEMSTLCSQSSDHDVLDLSKNSFNHESARVSTVDINGEKSKICLKDVPQASSMCESKSEDLPEIPNIFFKNNLITEKDIHDSNGCLNYIHDLAVACDSKNEPNSTCTSSKNYLEGTRANLIVQEVNDPKKAGIAPCINEDNKKLFLKVGCFSKEEIFHNEFIFKCYYDGCNFSSEDDDYFLAHIELYHSNASYEWDCNVCDENDKTNLLGLFRHLLNHSDAVCSTKEERGERKPIFLSFDFEDPCKALRNELFSIANSCFKKKERKFSLSNLYKDHNIIETYEYLTHIFKCMVGSCRFSSNDSEAYACHYHDCHQNTGNHSVEITGTKMHDFYCHYCNTLIENPVDHTINEHGSSVFQCPFCCFRAYSAMSVVVHQVCHQSNFLNAPVVLACFKKYRRKASSYPPLCLLKPYKCFVNPCSYTSFITSNFISHLRTHCVTMLSCFECGAEFDQLYIFLQHLLIHEIGKYHCAFCSHCFFHENDAISHVFLIHQDLPSKIIIRHEFACYRQKASRYFHSVKIFVANDEQLTQIDIDSVKNQNRLYHDILTQKRGKKPCKSESPFRDFNFNCIKSKKNMSIRIISETPPIRKFRLKDNKDMFEEHYIKDEVDVVEVYHNKLRFNNDSFYRAMFSHDQSNLYSSMEEPLSSCPMVSQFGGILPEASVIENLFVSTFKCYLCLCEVFKLQELYDHFLTYHKDSPIQFEIICINTYTNETNSSLIDKLLICYYCNKVLCSEEGLLNHFDDYHSDLVLKYSSISIFHHCPFCDEIFLQVIELTRHCFEWHEQIYLCDSCNLWYSFSDLSGGNNFESDDDIVCLIHSKSKYINIDLCYGQSENHRCEKFFSKCFPSLCNKVLSLICDDCGGVDYKHYQFSLESSCLQNHSAIPEKIKESVNITVDKKSHSYFVDSEDDLHKKRSIQKARKSTSNKYDVSWGHSTSKFNIKSNLTKQTARKSTSSRVIDHHITKKLSTKPLNQTARKSTTNQLLENNKNKKIVSSAERKQSHQLIRTSVDQTARKSTSQRLKLANISPKKVFNVERISSYKSKLFPNLFSNYVETNDSSLRSGSVDAPINKKSNHSDSKYTVNLLSANKIINKATTSYITSDESIDDSNKNLPFHHMKCFQKPNVEYLTETDTNSHKPSKFKTVPLIKNKEERRIGAFKKSSPQIVKQTARKSTSKLPTKELGNSHLSDKSSLSHRYPSNKRKSSLDEFTDKSFQNKENKIILNENMSNTIEISSKVETRGNSKKRRRLSLESKNLLPKTSCEVVQDVESKRTETFPEVMVIPIDTLLDSLTILK